MAGCRGLPLEELTQYHNIIRLKTDGLSGVKKSN